MGGVESKDESVKSWSSSVVEYVFVTRLTSLCSEFIGYASRSRDGESKYAEHQY